MSTQAQLSGIWPISGSSPSRHPPICDSLSFFQSFAGLGQDRCVCASRNGTGHGHGEAGGAGKRPLDVEFGQLQLEQSTWAMHARVEKIASGQLMMRVPTAARIQVVAPEAVQ